MPVLSTYNQSLVNSSRIRPMFLTTVLETEKKKKKGLQLIGWQKESRSNLTVLVYVSEVDIKQKSQNVMT